MCSQMRCPPRYAELHSHSAYSFLDGASRPEELVEKALELGYEALALTDHDSLSGAMELAIAAKGTPLKPIFGAEMTVQIERREGEGSHRRFRRREGEGLDCRCERREGALEEPFGDRGAFRHITLLVGDRRGWASLCRLITLAHSHTRSGPGRRAGQPSVTLEQVVDHADGLVCLSGCAGRGIEDEASLRRLLEAFGPRSLYIELQRTYARHDRARAMMRERLARRIGLKTVASGDVHAHSRERALLQDAFVAMRHRLTLDGCEAHLRPNHTHVLARPEALASRFAGHEDAVAESAALAETLNFDLCADLGYSYPGAEREDAARRLREVCEAAFDVRYAPGSKRRGEAALRLEEELAVIEKLRLSGFFLLHHEIFELAGEAAAAVRRGGSASTLLTPGRGRGSSVSSIVCYLTGLSHIDPVENGIAIGRFLHEEIESVPDIDLDFPRDVRERLIPMIHERYGRDCSALVAAFPTFRARGAIREIGRALGLPPGEIERVARTADGWGGEGAVAEAAKSVLGRERSNTGRWRWLVFLAEQAQRLPRHLSQHSGGMIVATRPLVDCCPIVPAAIEGRQIAQWDKDSCADAGFLKIDLLGLGMLSAVERCVETIASRTGEQVDLSRIPFDDEATFKCIEEAQTTGVFQIESRAQMSSLRRTRPRTLADLTIQVAIVRPGPIVGGAINPYIERRQRLLAEPSLRSEIPYPHPSLREPLSETLGTIVFQDQVIEVAVAFAGFTQGRAEGLRRAMSRRRSAEAIERHHREFVEGAMSTHDDVDEALAERVWQMVAGFAGFGFPKAHGAAFGLLAYQSAWLRVHHPAEFLCALLNEQPMGFYAPDSLIHEAQRRGVRVLPPEVCESDIDCTLRHDGAISMGLRYVKGLARRDAEALVAARRCAPFRSLSDLASRSGMSRAALELLASAGACDMLASGGDVARRRALWQLGMAAAAHRLKDGRMEQGGASVPRQGGGRSVPRQGGASVPRRGGGAVGRAVEGERQVAIQLALELDLPDAPALPPVGEWEAMLADYATTGVSIERHPLGLMRRSLRGEGVLCSAELEGVMHGEAVRVAGLVIARQRPSTAKGITFMLLEDEAGTINVIVSARLYERRRTVVRTEPLLLVGGRLERHESGGGTVNVVASDLEALDRSFAAGALRRSAPRPRGPLS